MSAPTVTYTGANTRGLSVGGTVETADIAAFVTYRRDLGWQRLDVFRDGLDVGGIDATGAVWTAERVCDCCREPECAESCLLHPKRLEEAAARGIAYTLDDVTPEGLDLYAKRLRVKAANR